MEWPDNPHNRWFNAWYSAHMSPGVQRNFPHAAMHVIRDLVQLQTLDHNVATFILSSMLLSVAFRGPIVLLPSFLCHHVCKGSGIGHILPHLVRHAAVLILKHVHLSGLCH